MLKTTSTTQSALLGLAALMLIASSADARTVTLRWSHADPGGEGVTGFRIYQRTPASGWGTPVELQLSQLNVSNGVYSHDVVIDDSAIAIFAASAISSSAESSKSAELQILPESQELVPGGSYLTSDDFDGSGSQPATWLDTGAGNSLNEDDSLFQVGTLESNGVLMTTSQGINIHSHVVPDDSTEWVDYEYRGRMRKSDDEGGIGVTAYSDYPRSDAYYRLRSSDSQDPFHLSIHPNGVELTCGSSTTGVSPVPDAWYHFKIRVETGQESTTFQASVWREGTAEPSSWQIECLDDRPDRLLGGPTGIWSMDAGEKYWDDLDVEMLVPATPPAVEFPSTPVILP